MAKKITTEILLWLLVLIIAFQIFGKWIGFGYISAGDLGFFYPVNIKEYLQPPLAWEAFRNSGLGGYAVPFQGSYFYNLPIGILSRFSTSFPLIQRLVWLWPILGFGFGSAWYLTRSVALLSSWQFLLVWVILTLNTYFLMIVSGGQITVALAYAAFPLVFAFFMNAVKRPKPVVWRLIAFSLLLSVLVAFDLRFAYLFFLTVFLYFLFELFFIKLSFIRICGVLKKYCFVFFPATLINIAMHFYWLFPLIFFKKPSLPVGYDKPGWVDFLSFANFSDSLSLLHPNWPEGIFGKTYFMRPGFLLLPILAFSSLLFINYSQDNELTSLKNKKQISPLMADWLIKNKLIAYFAFLALIGAFLAKGSKPPFGGIYLWLFDNFPGMSMFRDPTKFYTLVALSYSVLIPYSLARITQWFKSLIDNR